MKEEIIKIRLREMVLMGNYEFAYIWKGICKFSYFSNKLLVIHLKTRAIAMSLYSEQDFPVFFIS